MRRILLSAVLVAVTLAAVVAQAPEAGARDRYPCGEKYEHVGTVVQNCPLWRGNVPVYEWGDHIGDVVGYLTHGGRANWFVCQKKDANEPYQLGNDINDWWAWTMADNGKWGWVSLVYFTGGDNYEPDAKLTRCD
jgi:hypothetical protein